jgi:hypothetical protein
MRSTTLVVVLTATLTVGCGDAFGPEDVAGTYVLKTLNGATSPWAWGQLAYWRDEFVYEETVIELISATQQMNGDGTYSLTQTVRSTERTFNQAGEELDTTVSERQDTWHGTFTVLGGAIQFGLSDGSVYAGTLSGNVLTIVTGENTWVYER